MLVGIFNGGPVRRAQQVTKSPTKRRNPPWTYDELVLALDLYIRRGLPNVEDPEVLELSSLLNSLRTTDGHAPSGTLRNPNGVHLKLCNFRAKHQPGRGMPHGSHLENDVWDRFANKPAELEQAAQALRSRRVPSPGKDDKMVSASAQGQPDALIDLVVSLPIPGPSLSRAVSRPLMGLIREATELQLDVNSNQPGASNSGGGATLPFEDRIGKMFGLLAEVASALRSPDSAPPATAARLSRAVTATHTAASGTKLVIFPCGDRSSVRHFNRTVRRPVDLSALGLNWTELARNLPPDYPYEKARIWGVLPRKSGMNEKRFLRCSPGDVAIFTGGKKAFYAVKIRATFRSPELARALWHNDVSGQTWELIFALSNPTELSISYDKLSAALGYHPSFAYQSFSVLSAEVTDRARRALEAEIGHVWA